MGWGSSFAMSCGAGRRRGSDSVLLWLWRRPVAMAPIKPLAWESPCAVGAALEKAKKKKKKITGPFCLVPPYLAHHIILNSSVF